MNNFDTQRAKRARDGDGYGGGAAPCPYCQQLGHVGSACPTQQRAPQQQLQQLLPTPYGQQQQAPAPHQAPVAGGMAPYQQQYAQPQLAPPGVGLMIPGQGAPQQQQQPPLTLSQIWTLFWKHQKRSLKWIEENVQRMGYCTTPANAETAQGITNSLRTIFSPIPNAGYATTFEFIQAGAAGGAPGTGLPELNPFTIVKYALETAETIMLHFRSIVAEKRMLLVVVKRDILRTSFGGAPVSSSQQVQHILNVQSKPSVPVLCTDTLQIRGSGLKQLLADFGAYQEGDADAQGKRLEGIKFLFQMFGPCSIKETEKDFCVEVTFLPLSAIAAMMPGCTATPQGEELFAMWNAFVCLTEVQSLLVHKWSLVIAFKQVAAQPWDLLGPVGTRMNNLCPDDGRCPLVNDPAHQAAVAHTCTMPICTWLDNTAHTGSFRHR